MSFGSFVLLPNITGTTGWLRNATQMTGAFTLGDTAYVYNNNQSVTAENTKFDASRSNSIYNRSNSVQPSSLVLNYVIKY